MPSSISSSDRPARYNGWLRSLAWGVLIACAVIGVWEGSWRFAGFRPSIEDDLGIWAVKRRTVEDRGAPAVALIGASRMQLDVDPQVFQAVTGSKAVMLVIDGSSPLPVLADLAENSTFAGLVLCSLLPQWLADGGVDRGRSAKWVRKYHQQKWSFWIETRLSLLLQSNFVFRYPGLLPGELWENFQDADPVRPPYAPMRYDRYRPADYSKTDISALRAARIERQREIVAAAHPLTQNEFANRIDRLENMALQIRKRGGRVIFLRMPSCGEILELEEKTWPRSRYWDPFASAVTARTVHFADYPSLSGYDCPDGSHIGYQDAGTFTRALADVLGPVDKRAPGKP